jgi:hypothetical protein
MPYALDFFHSVGHTLPFSAIKNLILTTPHSFSNSFYPQMPNNSYKLEQAGIAQIPTLMNSVLTPIAHSHVQSPQAPNFPNPDLALKLAYFFNPDLNLSNLTEMDHRLSIHFSGGATCGTQFADK